MSDVAIMGQLLSRDVLSRLGLSLDIAGVILLFFFGLPADVRKDGGLVLMWGGDPEEARRYRQARVLSCLGLALLVVGLGLQIAGNHVGARALAALSAVPCPGVGN